MFLSSHPPTNAPQKVRAQLAAHPNDAKTLESLLTHDKASHPNTKDRKASEGLLWLLRGLKFTALGLRSSLTNKDEELSVSFTKAYEGSLKKYHGMLVRPVFYVSLVINITVTCDAAGFHVAVISVI
jgi:hypothetical protein